MTWTSLVLFATAAPLRVRLGYFTQSQPFTVACARHFFDSPDVEVSCWPQPSGPKAVSKLEDGLLDFAVVGSTPVAEGIARGVPIQAVYISIVGACPHQRL